MEKDGFNYANISESLSQQQASMRESNKARKEQTLIQIKTNYDKTKTSNNSHMFRIFYLCMLQSPILLKPLINHIELLLTTETDNLIMQDNLGENTIWI